MNENAIGSIATVYICYIEYFHYIIYAIHIDIKNQLQAELKRLNEELIQVKAGKDVNSNCKCLGIIYFNI